MEKVKTAFEKAMERAAKISALTPDEKEEIKDQEKIRSVLSAFYKGEIKRDELWQKLKGTRQSLLKEAQCNIVDSIRLETMVEELYQKKDGILAIETLKEKQNISIVENLLNTIIKLQKEYMLKKDEAIEELREAVEQNPQLRLRQVKTPDGRTVLQPMVSVDEAVQAKMAEYLLDLGKRYDELFTKGIEKLKEELR
jgi:O-phosphoseryl-tRNA(Cys) synthetase